MNDFNFSSHKNLIKAFQENKPYLLDLETLIKEIKFGKLYLTFTIANEKVVSMEIGSQQLVRYDKGERLKSEKLDKR